MRLFFIFYQSSFQVQMRKYNQKKNSTLIVCSSCKIQPPGFLTRAMNRGHITPHIAPLHRLPVSLKIDFKILLFVYKALNGSAPSYIYDCLSEFQNNLLGLVLFFYLRLLFLLLVLLHFICFL